MPESRSSAMVLRTVRKGSAAGLKFWGCADYPTGMSGGSESSA